MTIDDRMLHFTSAATIKQFLEVLLKEIKDTKKDKGNEETGVRDENKKETILS
jgi:hypothetical protein